MTLVQEVVEAIKSATKAYLKQVSSCGLTVQGYSAGLKLNSTTDLVKQVFRVQGINMHTSRINQVTKLMPAKYGIRAELVAA